MLNHRGCSKRSLWLQGCFRAALHWRLTQALQQVKTTVQPEVWLSHPFSGVLSCTLQCSMLQLVNGVRKGPWEMHPLQWEHRDASLSWLSEWWELGVCTSPESLCFSKEPSEDLPANLLSPTLWVHTWIWTRLNEALFFCQLRSS